MFGWIGHLPSPYRVAPGLHLGLFPKIYLLHAFWCYWVMSYHFGKQQIFDLVPRSRVVGVKGGTWKRVKKIF